MMFDCLGRWVQKVRLSAFLNPFRITARARGGIAANKRILMGIFSIATVDGKSVMVAAHRTSRGIELDGPQLEKMRCRPGVSTVGDVKIQIAKLFKVSIDSVIQK